MTRYINLSRIEVDMTIYLCVRPEIALKTRRETEGSRALNICLRVRGVSMRCRGCPGIGLIRDFSLWFERYLGI